MDLIIPSAVSIVAIGLYVVALWIGDHRTMSTLVGASDLIVALTVIMVGLAYALGMPMSAGLLVNPNNWIQAVGGLIQSI